MIREELDELDIIIRDVSMAIDIKEQIESGQERGLIDFADGTNLTVPIPEAVKTQLDDKIHSLIILLKQKAGIITPPPETH